MAEGYTPAFGSIYTGTLYGKWPEAAVWATLLPLINARGEINLSPEAIAGMTGWPMNLLHQGIEALCKPDPRSRSKAEDGRRLVLIDPARDWGWRVVNVTLYRAKAAGLNQVADGRNAEKVRRYKERHRATPEDTSGHRGTPQTPETPHSDSDSYTDKEKNKSKSQRSRKALPTPLRGSRLPADFTLTPDRRQVAEAEALDAERVFASFCDYWRSAAGAKARKCDWEATWRNWCRSEAGRRGSVPRPPGRKTYAEYERESAERLASLPGEDPGPL